MKYFIASLLVLSGSVYSSFLIYLTTQKQIQEDKAWFVSINNKIDDMVEIRRQHNIEMDCLDYYWEWRSNEIHK